MMAGMRERLIPAAIVFVITICVLLPSALSLPQHPDEAQYGWSAAYFGNKVTQFDFSPRGSDPFSDPGWFPYSYWSLTQPMAGRLLYATVLAATGAPTPTMPYSFTDPALQGPEVFLAADTLLILRLTAIVSAALGLALIVWRLGWPAVAASALFLAIPFVRDDLARAWAEGPLLLGFGLCAIAWGSRWLIPAVGLAASFKLTALVLWPLVIALNPIGRSPLRRVLPLLATSLCWSFSSPASWFALGPLYLLPQLAHRIMTYSSQSADYGADTAGLFLPTRYLWPLLLLALLAIAHQLNRRVGRSVYNGEHEAV